MARYYATYKCALCGRIIRYGNPTEVTESQLPELLGRVIQNQQFAGNPYLYQAPMYIPHKCGNGNGGLAQFAGFAKE
ncbi:MAG: hypothetical protein IJD35_02645 [Clostridia bacterium]|nr:hypothetical protein [Clostridia bacterium]